jgi:site-specific recombinase XerD
MKVTVRTKKINKGKELSLYLDVYISATERYKEALGMKLYVQPTKEQKGHNTATRELAERIATKRLIELQEGFHGVYINRRKYEDFIGYFEMLTEQRKKTGINFHHWDSTLKQLVVFCKAKKMRPKFTQVTQHFLEDFKQFLVGHLSTNTAAGYFNKVKHALHQASRDKLIIDNPADLVRSPKIVESNREFLTLDEVEKLAATPCKKELYKRAFLFGCLTGLRISDIIKLTWKEIRYNEEMKWHIVYAQQKTKKNSVLMINEQAREFLGEAGMPEDRVFKNLKYSAWHNMMLRDWAVAAGVMKPVSFHVARHTFATLQLTMGTDLYTVSQMLGHSKVSTTQIYGKIIDDTKRKAADRLPYLNVV